MVYEKVIK